MPMPLRPIVFKLVATICMLITIQAHADNVPVQNRYRIEMILFTDNAPDNFTQEEWPSGISAPDMSKAVALFAGQQATGFTVLPSRDYELQTAARRLQSSGRYTVLAHLAWEQPGLAMEQAIPVAITAGRDFASLYPALTTPRFVTQGGQSLEIPAPQHLYRLSGTVKIVLGHYLHVYTNLVLNVPSQPLLGNNGKTTQIEDTSVIDNPAALPAPGGTLTQVHIIEHRRTRSRVLNYMDQPLLGILIEIWPIGNSR